jgi:hypothetical protein
LRRTNLRDGIVMMVRNIMALLLLVTLGWGCGRSKMFVPASGHRDAAVPSSWPDTGVITPDIAVRDTNPLSPERPASPDLAPLPPDVPPSADWLLPTVPPDAGPDLRAADLPTEGPPVPPDLRIDLPSPVPPDAQLDGWPPVSPDTLPDGLHPVPPDALPDRPPPIIPDGAISPDGWVWPDLMPLPDLVPPPDLVPLPDLVPPPDLMPPAQSCVAGGACTSDCTATCGTFGVMACVCMNGTLSCSSCQVLPITISPDPCPPSPTGKECTTDGVACIAFTNGSISGACICTLPLGDTILRWSCILR